MVMDCDPAAETTGNGSTMSGLTKAVESVGLKAEGVQVNLEALGEVEMPAIAWVNHNHFVAVLASHSEGANASIIIHDPNKLKEETVSNEQLLRMCGGYMLLIHK